VIRPEDAPSVGSAQMMRGVPGVFDVVLSRSSLSTGFGFGLGKDGIGNLFVSSCKEGGLAIGKLEENDQFLAMNGSALATVTYEECIEMIKSSFELKVTVARGLAVVLVELEKGSTGFGFGMDKGSQAGHVVAKVKPDGAASGKLHEGDRIVEVNGILASSIPDTPAMLEMFKSAESLSLRVARMDDGAEDFLYVDLIRESGQSLGLSLAQAEDGSHVVDKIAAGGLAAEAGLVSGDFVMELNGTSTVGLTHLSVVDMVKSQNRLRFAVQRHEEEQVVERVKLMRATNMDPWGFAHEKKNAGRPESFEHVVVEVAVGSAADGKLNVGDCVLTIAGVDCSDCSTDELDERLGSGALSCQLEVRRCM